MGDVVSGKDKESSEKSWQLAGAVGSCSWQSVNSKSLRKSAVFLCGTSARNKNI